MFVAAEPKCRTAFATRVLPHARELLARARRLERSSCDAHDLVQDTFERAWRQFDRLQPESDARLWLHTLLFHLFVDRHRRRLLERRHLRDLAATDPIAVPVDEEPAHDPPVSGQELSTALSLLPPPFDSIARLNWVERRSYRHISERLGIPMSTVGTRLLRARSKMRELLERGSPKVAIGTSTALASAA